MIRPVSGALELLALIAHDDMHRARLTEADVSLNVEILCFEKFDIVPGIRERNML